MSAKITVYRVRDCSTGLYMTGRGIYPHFSDRGEIYLTVQGARSAIRKRSLYDWEGADLIIEEDELTPTQRTLDVSNG